MRTNWIWGCMAAALLAVTCAAGPGDKIIDQRQPVLVELFTSEGCSSCPPADALLEKLDHEQPVAGAQIIVLSEHVDYWNQGGWKDPYSSTALTERQERYARNLHIQEPYTPQTVIDGSFECVGADPRKVVAGIQQAIGEANVAVRMTPAASGDAVEIDVDPLPAGKVHKANVYLARAADSGISNVLRGENSGRKLHHVAVVSELKQIGSVTLTSGFKTQIPIHSGDAPAGSKLIAFVQESGPDMSI